MRAFRRFESILPNFKDRVKARSKSHKDLPPQACAGKHEGAQYRSCDEEGPHRRGSRRTRPVPVAHGGRRGGAGRRGPGRPRRPAGAAPEPAGRARGRSPRRRRPAVRLAGGIKLENALEALAIDLAGRDCLDVGASTGGFSDCMLQRGAARVAAVDVAYGQIAQSMRDDPRVTVDRAAQRPRDAPLGPSLRCPASRRSTSPSSRWPRSCPRWSPAWSRAASCWRWSSRSSSSAASGSAGASSATRATAARRSSASPRPLAASGSRCAASRPRGCRGRRATSRPSSGAPARARASRTSPAAFEEVDA